MTENPQVSDTATGDRPEQWKPIPGFGSYEVSDHGSVRSVDRVLPSGRAAKGIQLKTRPSNRGYVLVNVTDDAGVKRTCTVHTLVLTAFAGHCPKGMEARHADDDSTNNRWAPGSEEESKALGGNLFWGTHGRNERDKFESGRHPRPVPPARPKPPCILCGKPVDKGGRRCHACVVGIGGAAAELLTSGNTLAEVMKRLDYPSAEGLHMLAVKYGGYGQAPEHTASWLRRVSARLAATLRGRPGRGDAR